MSAIEQSQTGDEPTTKYSLDPRDARALSERMTVLPEGGDVYEVVSESGSSYSVDGREGRCTCPDAEHNLPDGDRKLCKHAARVRFATGQWSIPSWADTDAIDPLLGCHVDGTPRIASSDGGSAALSDETGSDDCDECAELGDGWTCADCYISVDKSNGGS